MFRRLIPLVPFLFALACVASAYGNVMDQLWRQFDQILAYSEARVEALAALNAEMDGQLAEAVESNMRLLEVNQSIGEELRAAEGRILRQEARIARLGTVVGVLWAVIAALAMAKAALIVLKKRRR